MRRFFWLLATLACAPHGVELSDEPTVEPPAPEAAQPTKGPDGCDHDPPAWLTADILAEVGALPNAPNGPGIPAKDREPRHKYDAWSVYVHNDHLEDPEGPQGCRSQYFLEGDRRPVATRSFQREKSVVKVKQDRGTDGTIDLRMTWSYDERGALSRYVEKTPRRWVCGTKVPAWKEERRFIYDRFGFHLRTDVDEEIDGTVERTEDWRAIRYDDDGLPSLVVQFDRLGRPRVIERFKWGPDARLVERTVQNEKGVLTEAERNDYGGHGQRRWRSEFVVGKGWKTDRFHYDDNGDLVTYDTDTDGDCTADEHTALTYNAAGDLETATTTEDGITKTLDTYTYDAQRRLLRFSRSRGAVRAAEFRETAYDGAGRVTMRRVREVRPRAVFEDEQRNKYDDAGNVIERWLQRGSFGPEETVKWSHTCGRRYRRFAALDPRDDPELAEHCFADFE